MQEFFIFFIEGSGVSGSWVQGLGIKVQGSGFRKCEVQGLGLRVWGSGFRVEGAGFKVQCLECGVQNLGLGV